MNWTLHCGDARSVLQTLPDESVNCVVTSPPYFNLRDYGHEDQIGSEESPEEFARAIVGVFQGVKRVLAEDGTVWINIGDTYRDLALVGAPWRVAFALQADGWLLRSEIIWAKLSCMPEPVVDRPTRSHEQVFLLAKGRGYRYDADAIRTPYAESSVQRVSQRTFDTQGGGEKDYAARGMEHTSGSSTRRAVEKLRCRILGQYAGQATKAYDAAGVQNPSDTKRRVLASMADGIGANARTVWTINTEPSPYEHFAVMPKALARKCILAGSKFGGVVLDPFAGVATTGVVALEEGRSFVGIELNPKYHAMARERLANVAPLLATEIPV